jgi:hypothetical protein
MVATISNRPQISFWDPNNNYAPKGEIDLEDIQMCVKWCGSYDKK